MLRPPLGDLVLRIALPVPDPQLPEPVVDDRLTAEQRREGCRRLHGTSERARHKPVDRLLSKDVGDRRGGPQPSRLDALVEPTHRPALAVRGRAAVADQVDACHPSLLSVARACWSASPNGSRSRWLRSTNSPRRDWRNDWRNSVPRSWVGFPHSFPSAAESVRRRRSNLTPILVVAQESRTVSQPPPNGAP